MAENRTLPRHIRLQGVKQNNLKNVTVEFPMKRISVVTGLSGSGKSSLVFDTLYAEGQRRYVESLSTYTRQFLEKMPKPEVELVQNIPPAIALEQKNHVVNSRSTVGTQTELVDYLRLLYAKIGRTDCMTCGTEVKKLDSQTLVDFAVEWLPGRKALILAPLASAEETAAEAAAEDAKKPKKKTARKGVAKAAKKTAKKGKAPAAGMSLLHVLKEQGFSRLYLEEAGDASAKRAKSAAQGAFVLSARGEVRDLDELDPKELEGKRVSVVIDRLRIAAADVESERARILDSIDQAVAVGRGKIAFVDLEQEEAKTYDLRFACPKCGREHRVPEPNLFSFNSPIGACPTCSGFGYNLELDENLVVPDPNKTLRAGALDPFSKPSFAEWQKDLFRFAERHGIPITRRYRELTAPQRKLLWDGDPEDDSFLGVRGCFADLARYKYKLHVRVFIRRYQAQSLCGTCHGTRLNPEALAVRVGRKDQAKNISEALNTPISDSLAWLRARVAGGDIPDRDRKISKEILFQVERRLAFLEEVGVGYLTLARLAKSLSGGEFQRINLATQLGNGLCGTLYILDEPSIGLHASDTARLIRVLKRLRDQGNTVVVVEHDLEVMKAADWIVELGPLAGRKGGELVAQGPSADIAANDSSTTGKYISGRAKVDRVRSARSIAKNDAKRWLKITGCRENNLRGIDVEIPLDRLVVATGVSGSGKSTLVHKTLYNALAKLFHNSPEGVGAFDRLYGADQINGVVLLDQSPIGRSSRSNPATYLKAWDEIRRIYANQVLSLRRGYTAQHFSFNVDGGRCPVCKGEGEVTLDMHFMAEVRLPCEECGGKRFKKAVLDVTYRGRDIYQLLTTTIDEAFELFRDNSVLARKFGILRDVGLGYLQVGQSGTTLSGGESQRLKIAATLDERDNGNLLYVFDEPTTGLHLDDVKRLIGVIQDLVDAKHSVLMIEHHLDVIAQADYVVDLGPGGGEKGGALVAAGSPDQLMKDEGSPTGQVLREHGYFLQTGGRSG